MSVDGARNGNEMTWHPLSLYKICEASDKAKRELPQSYLGVSLCTPGCQWYQQEPLSQEEEKDEMVEKKLALRHFQAWWRQPRT